jgi:hypothetical protein
MKYFRQEEEPRARFPKNFISGFLEVTKSDRGNSVWTMLTVQREGIDASEELVPGYHCT